MSKRDKERKKKKSKGRVLDFNEALEKKKRKEEARKRAEEEKARKLEKISKVRSDASVKRGKKQARRRLVAIALAVAAIVAIAVFSFKHVVKLKMEEKDLKSQQEMLIKEKKKLTKDLNKSKDADHIENEARRQLKMIKPGEILFLLPKGDSKSND